MVTHHNSHHIFKGAYWLLSGLGVCALVAAPLADSLGLSTLLCSLVVILIIGKYVPEVGVALLIGFLIRALAALFHTYVAPLPDSQFDATTFEQLGFQWSQGGLKEVFYHFTTGAFFYSWLISLLYTLTERSALMIQALNVFFGSLIILNVFCTSRHLWGSRNAVCAAWFVCLFPTLILYSSITMREVAVVYCFSLAVLYTIRWRKFSSTIDFTLACVFFAASTIFHTGIFIALIILIITACKDVFFAPDIRALGNKLVAPIVITLTIAILVTSGLGLGKVGSLSNVSFERLQTQQEVASRDRAAYLDNIPVQGPIDIVWQAPVRVIYFLLMPFPWMIRGAADVVGLIDSLLYFLVFICLWRSYFQIRQRKGGKTLFYILSAVLLLFSISTSNYGTAIRHRAKVLPLAISLVGIMPWENKFGKSKFELRL